MLCLEATPPSAWSVESGWCVCPAVGRGVGANTHALATCRAPCFAFVVAFVFLSPHKMPSHQPQTRDEETNRIKCNSTEARDSEEGGGPGPEQVLLPSSSRCQASLCVGVTWGALKPVRTWARTQVSEGSHCGPQVPNTQ